MKTKLRDAFILLGASASGFTVGYFGWMTGMPVVIVLVITAGIACIIGGIVGLWPWLMDIPTKEGAE